MVRKLYPGGKQKVFNISYDDGIEQDVRFVELLNRYGLKGTFNLNSGLMKQEFVWTHECGLQIKRLPESSVTGLYAGHEVASHTYSHPYMDDYTEAEILKELGADRFFLEQLFGKKVTGYATPFYFYSDLLEKCIQESGFEYARISEKSNDFSVPEDFYHWRGSKFHWDADLEEFLDRFLQTDQELAMCQLVGHSYDLDVFDMWDRMERICRKVGNADDVWPATHIQIVRYLRSMEQAEITTSCIVNHGAETLWFAINGETISIEPGEKEEIK